MRRTRQFLFTMTLAISLATTAAAADDTELESFRNDLQEYVTALEALPQPVLGQVFDDQPSFAELERQIATMPEDELRTMHEALRELPYWRQLPQMLAAAGQTGTAPTPAQLESILDRRVARTDRMQDEVMNLIDALRRLAEGAPESAGLEARIDALETRLTNLSRDQLISLSHAMAEDAPQWRKTLEAAAAGRPLPVRAKATCSESFPAGVLCEIGNIIDAIAAIPGQIVSFAEDALDSILSVFTTVVDAFPTDPNQILAAMGLDDPNWFNDVLSSVPILSPPCPSGDLPGLGTVGTIEAEYRCKRGLDWIAGAIYENAPDDIWGVPIKVPAMIVYYPVNYLCLCMESEARIAFDDDQLAHRELVAAMLDVTVSSRSTQASVDVAQAATWDLDGDVAAVEAKLDVIEGKTDTLIDGSDAQGESIGDFEALALQMRIEADLIREGNHRVSVFQLPAAFGGYLEVVRAIVADTVASASASGADTTRAERDLEDGDFAFDDGFFKDAYGYYRDAYQSAMKELR